MTAYSPRAAALVAVALTTTVLLPIAAADVLVSNDVVTGGDATRWLGQTAEARVWLDAKTHSGDANGCNAGGGPGSSPVTITLATSPSGILSLSATELSIGGCGEANARSFTYTVVGGNVGDVATVSATATGGKSGSTYTSDGFTVTIVPPPNTPPTLPGVPFLAPGSVTPNAGAFTLAWDPSTDAEGDDIVYGLERRDADDADWAGVDGAGALTSPAFAFTAAALAPEGTWTFRVSASDGTLSSGASDASVPILVDRSAPPAPTAMTDRAPDHGLWWKDTVTVSFSDNGDAVLSDGSAGSGVASVMAPLTYAATGTSTAVGVVTDAVGWTSAEAFLDVRVDADAPGLLVSDCPTEAVMRNSVRSASFEAWDAESGLDGPTLGTIPLATDELGAFTATVTVRDNVGHETSSACTYTVIGYHFEGFYNPANGGPSPSGKTSTSRGTMTSPDGTLWNGARAGSTIPLKFDAFLGNDADGWAEWTQPQAGTVDIVTFSAWRVDCAGGDEQPSEEAVVATGGTDLRYDAVDGQFIYNWKSPSAKGCYVLTMTGLDGSRLVERFVLR